MFMLYCLFVNILVKMTVFGTISGDMFKSDVVWLAITSSLVEHTVFIAAIFIIQRRTIPVINTPSQSKFHRKIYLSLAVPEIAKAFAVALQTWDTGNMLLLFIGLLILSIQYNAYSIVIWHHFPHSNTLYVFLIANIARLLCRTYFYGVENSMTLGLC
jgi:hypothetical protein